MNLGVETESVTEYSERPALFQHSLMNLGVETISSVARCFTTAGVSAFSDESWGGDPARRLTQKKTFMFQHSLMNLGVETQFGEFEMLIVYGVSAFSDESWGGDPCRLWWRRRRRPVSAFSDESWGGDPCRARSLRSRRMSFSIL